MCARSAGQHTPAPPLDDPGKVVIKIGSSLLVDSSTGRLRVAWLEALAGDIVGLRARGAQVVVVSSGAVALGRRHLGDASSHLRLDEKQAAAALGQVDLANGYREVFARAQLPVAQVLLTFYDTENRRRYLNARRTIFSLLAAGAVPVVNENDTVATEELRYGDNDRLAARVAQMIDARLLILLSDVDGLYTANPATDPGAEHVAQVPVITDDIARMAGGAGTAVGTGGMQTKILAARIAVAAGCGVMVADGRVAAPISAVHDGARHTWFAPSGTPGSARKRWIAGSLEPRGTLNVDAGARDALLSGRSLLCVGVASVSGQFDRGDAVRVACGDETLGVGLSAYDHADAARLAGAPGADIEARLGYPARPEMIHRDDLVLHATEACA